MIKKLIIKSILGLIGVTLISCSQQKVYNNADELIAEMELGMETIDAQNLKGKIDDLESFFYLIDVREPSVHNFGYIPGSFNISAGTILFNITYEKFWDYQMMYIPELQDEIIIYCKKGKRSILAVNFLQQLGFTNIKFIDGGC